jgi:hypothetical protein
MSYVDLPLNTPVIYSWIKSFSTLVVVKRIAGKSKTGRNVSRYMTMSFDFRNNPHMIQAMSDPSDLYYQRVIGSTDLTMCAVYWDDTKAVTLKSKP